MGVVYIGDREVGKTHLMVELANPRGSYVKVSINNLSHDLSYQYLKKTFLDDGGKAKPTRSIDTRHLDVQVSLPSRESQIIVDWTDPPGEVFRKSWQSDRSDEWSDFLGKIQKSEGIFLILPPYREILKSDTDVNYDEYITKQQWCNRFDRWVDFFRYDCPQARHIVICLNKADLLLSCDLDKEAEELIYDPDGSPKKWPQRHNYVVNRYFRPVKAQLDQINRSRSGLSVRCFITSIYNRTLLELPWIYMGSFLAN